MLVFFQPTCLLWCLYRGAWTYLGSFTIPSYIVFFFLKPLQNPYSTNQYKGVTWHKGFGHNPQLAAKKTKEPHPEQSPVYFISNQGTKTPLETKNNDGPPGKHSSQPLRRSFIFHQLEGPLKTSKPFCLNKSGISHVFQGSPLPYHSRKSPSIWGGYFFSHVLGGGVCGEASKVPFFFRQRAGLVWGVSSWWK